MADRNKDINMEEVKQPKDVKIDTLMDMLDNNQPENKEEQKSSISSTQLEIDGIKSTLDRYKIAVYKGDFANIHVIVKDLKRVLDKIDKGVLPSELDKMLPIFIRIMSEKKFLRAEIDVQAVINGFLQYWMYKRVKKEHLYKENLNALGYILNDDSSFYSLQYTGKYMDEMKLAWEDVQKTNPVLFTHIDDFVETNRIVYSVFYIENLNAFCKLDGFATILSLLQDKSHRISLNYLKEILDMFIPFKSYLKQEYKEQFFSGIADKILEIFKLYSDEDLKAISQDEMIKFINCFEYLVENIYSDKKAADKIIQKFELDLALRYIHTPYIEKRVNGLNILISKVNQVNKSNFPCTWKRKAYYDNKTGWLTQDKFLDWLLDHDIFGLFFGEKLHSELVVKYYAVLSFLYSKDQLTEKHFEVIWDCAINKHEAYRVNILKVLSSLALKVKPSHAKFLYDKIKAMNLSEYCKFTLMLLKHLNKNVCKGPVSDQAAHEAGFGKEPKVHQRHQARELDDLLDIRRIAQDNLNTRKTKKTRSLSLGGDDKTDDIKMNSLQVTPALDVSIEKKRSFKNVELLPQTRPKEELKEEIKEEEVKLNEPPKFEDDKQSTDEEDKLKRNNSPEDDVKEELKQIKERLVIEENKKNMTPKMSKQKS